MNDPGELLDALENRPESYEWSNADVIARFGAALRAVLDLHEEQENTEIRHGHWEGYGSNERWIRDEPNVCPVCLVDEPCPTVQAIIRELEGK